MSMTIVYTIITLSAIGTLAAVILYFVAQKFKVYEDPRIDDVEKALPGANCGGCGFAGCRAFAEACVKADDLASLYCPVGGNDCMSGVAGILGLEAVVQTPKVAVVRCNGSCEHRPKTNQYDGALSCAVAASLYSGDTGCQYGCLGCGDCVVACDFDAIHMNPETGLPEVIDDKCVACGACVEACPKTLIELRKKGPKDRKIYVACRNEDKGGIAKKSCEVACIGCSKCFKVCPFDAITMSNNLAFIDADKCKLCRKCVLECPTNAIIEVNFPPRKIKEDLPPKPAEKAEKPVAAPKSATDKNQPDNTEN
ncbi:Fe-S cluster domain-containing protein [Gaoshiqia sediminis]|uniref:Ion-translocating oxidoreductase complex subunit B n=1 Tax=Gaoshiqia sediminis TaxID=2986998 RepID=A0AA41YC20_9BACT|nr:Fe-S cluster domain-containing protein [Gaoshiqia sediminis]MCW0482097.1 Fe-S cluster domain-containing protein [Gaoshiqia sediminis]